MTDAEFTEFMRHFTRFMEEEDLGRIRFLAVTMTKAARMDALQYEIFSNALVRLMKEKTPKEPSCKPEFDKIMKGFWK